MRIEISVEPDAPDLCVRITCAELTPEIERLLATIRMLDHKLTGRLGDETHVIDLGKVLYIEGVDRKSYICTASDTYESDLPLMQLERRIEDGSFVRVSRTFLVNLRKIRSLRAESGRRIRVTMENGEQIIASRQYADELKKRLGVT